MVGRSMKSLRSACRGQPDGVLPGAMVIQTQSDPYEQVEEHANEEHSSADSEAGGEVDAGGGNGRSTDAIVQAQQRKAA